MCSCGQATIRTGGTPDHSDGRAEEEDRCEGDVPLGKKSNRADLAPRNRHAPAAPGTICDLRDHWQTAQLQQ